jgi:ankyrin repeat protein
MVVFCINEKTFIMDKMNGIFKAARNGSLTEIKELVADSIDINTKDSLGRSLLYYAA